jgi:hypothetical protein
VAALVGGGGAVPVTDVSAGRLATTAVWERRRELRSRAREEFAAARVHGLAARHAAKQSRLRASAAPCPARPTPPGAARAAAPAGSGAAPAGSVAAVPGRSPAARREPRRRRPAGLTAAVPGAVRSSARPCAGRSSRSAPTPRPVQLGLFPISLVLDARRHTPSAPPGKHPPADRPRPPARPALAPAGAQRHGTAPGAVLPGAALVSSSLEAARVSAVPACSPARPALAPAGAQRHGRMPRWSHAARRRPIPCWRSAMVCAVPWCFSGVRACFGRWTVARRDARRRPRAAWRRFNSWSGAVQVQAVLCHPVGFGSGSVGGRWHGATPDAVPARHGVGSIPARGRSGPHRACMSVGRVRARFGW